MPEVGCPVWNALADRDVFVMPGSVMQVLDHFRICLTASEPIIERSRPAVAQVANLVRNEEHRVLQ